MAIDQSIVRINSIFSCNSMSSRLQMNVELGNAEEMTTRPDNQSRLKVVDFDGITVCDLILADDIWKRVILAFLHRLSLEHESRPLTALLAVLPQLMSWLSDVWFTSESSISVIDMLTCYDCWSAGVQLTYSLFFNESGFLIGC